MPKPTLPSITTGIQRELQLSVGIDVRGGHQVQLLDSHAFLKRLSNGVQTVLHSHGGLFLGLFCCGQTGGTHRMEGVAFARIAFSAQDGGKELRHISRRRDGCNIHAKRGLEQLQHISTIKAAHIRAMNFEPFAFRINGEALPELLDEYLFKHKDPGKGKKEKFDPYKDITEKQHRIALEAAFTLKDEYGYKELAEELRKTYASVGVMLGGNRLTDLITVLKNKRMIVQENGRKYTFKPDFHY